MLPPVHQLCLTLHVALTTPELLLQLQLTAGLGKSKLLCHGSQPTEICLAPAGEHIENTLEALRALINKDNETPGGLKTLAYIEFDVHVSRSLCLSTCGCCMLSQPTQCACKYMSCYHLAS